MAGPERNPISHLRRRSHTSRWPAGKWRAAGDGGGYFLDSCFLCRKRLGSNRDIFMYRGDTAFCSEDCRQEQIEMDEAKERNRSCFTSKDQPEKLGGAGRRVHVAAAGTVAG